MIYSISMSKAHDKLLESQRKWTGIFFYQCLLFPDVNSFFFFG